MIDKLTQEQLNKFPLYVKKWTDIGLSTEPADKKTAEEGVRLAYKNAGLKPPTKIVWCGSPLSNGLVRLIVTKILTDKKIGQSVWQSVRQSVWQSVGQSVRKSVRQSVWQSVWQSVGQSVEQSVRQSVRQSVWQSVEQSGYGQHDANWLGFYDYFYEECELKSQTNKLLGLWLIAQSGGWYLPHENICWISERPKTLNRNIRGQLHCENGPAMEYPDGWCIWSLNGVLVPSWLVTTDAGKIDPMTALTEKNVDIQREIIRKVGAERVLKAANAKTLDVWTDDRPGERGREYKLMGMKIGENINRKYLYFEHASLPGVFYAHPINPGITKALHARAWMIHAAELDELGKVGDNEIEERLPKFVS